MSREPAARVGDDVAHSNALLGALVGLAVGAVIGVAAVAFVVGTGGAGAAVVMAAGAAVATSGGLGMAGQYIGESMEGPTTGQLVTGSGNVFTNGKQATAAKLSTSNCRNKLWFASCSGGSPQQVATGSGSVFINGHPAARKNEKLTCSSKITGGSSNVFIGGESVQVLPMEPEVPAWLSNTMLGMVVVGTIVGFGGAGFAFGWGAAVGGLALGFGGSMAGGWAGGWLAQQLGFGETGQRIGEVAGGFAGGLLGGWGGSRLGARVFPKFPVPKNLPTNIHMGLQGKHIKGHSNFIEGRSYLKAGVDPGKLLTGVHSRKYPIIGKGSRGNPIVNFRRPIGVDGKTGQAVNNGQIHYGNKGAHIVPDAREIFWKPGSWGVGGMGIGSSHLGDPLDDRGR